MHSSNICFSQPKSEKILELNDFRSIELGLSADEIKKIYGNPFFLSAPNLNIREMHYTCLDALGVKRRLCLYFDASEKLIGKELAGPGYGTLIKIGKGKSSYKKSPISTETALVKSKKANIRSKPNISESKIITIANKNEPLIVFTRTGGKYKVGKQKDYWYNVQRDKNKTAGWVFGADIRLLGKLKEADKTIEKYKGNKYINYRASIEFNKPNDWNFLPQKIMEQIRIKFVNTYKRPGIAKEDVELLVKVLKYPYGKPVEYNPEVSVLVIDIKNIPGIENSFDAASSSKARKKDDKKIKKISKIEKSRIIDQDFAYYEYTFADVKQGKKRIFKSLCAYFVRDRKEFEVTCTTLKKDYKNYRDVFLNIIYKFNHK